MTSSTESATLLLLDAGRFSVDHLIERRIPAWRWISDFSR
jgi:hypothetical protein